MMFTYTSNLMSANANQTKIRWGWLLAFGLILMTLGVLSIGYSALVTISSVVFVGAFLYIASTFQVFLAISSNGWRDTLLNFTIALAYLAGGTAMIMMPYASSAFLTVTLAAVFILVGCIRVALAFLQVEGPRPWLLAISGLASMLVGGMTLVNLPVASAVFIGLCVSVEVVIHGSFLTEAALRLRLAQSETHSV